MEISLLELMYRLYRSKYIYICTYMYLKRERERERDSHLHLRVDSPNLFRREGRFSPKRTNTAMLFLAFGGERVVTRGVSWSVFLKPDALWVDLMSGARLCRV